MRNRERARATTTEKVLLSWSGGKDSTLALHELRRTGRYDVVALLTTITNKHDRISMHGVRRSLLERQADSLGITLEKVFLSENGSIEEYETQMRDILEKYLADGISSVVFGDIFLEDVREYRESNLSKVGMNALFPLWEKNTTELANAFIDLGFHAVTTCIDSSVLGREFVGRAFDRQFLSELPNTTDPCGENGEFHSFAYDGPLFQKPIRFMRGRVVLRDGRFYYCDLTPL